MVRINYSCRDNATGLEVVAKECSYNQACSFLEAHKGTSKFVSLAKRGKNTLIQFTTRTFLYDEERGILLGY